MTKKTLDNDVYIAADSASSKNFQNMAERLKIRSQIKAIEASMDKKAAATQPTPPPKATKAG